MLQYSWGFCVCHQLSKECERWDLAFKATNTNTESNSLPNFRQILPARFHECNKVELDLLKKTSCTLLNISYLNSTIFWGALVGPMKPGVLRHRGYLCMLQAFFPLEILPGPSMLFWLHKKEHLHVLLLAYCENIKKESKKMHLVE